MYSAYGLVLLHYLCGLRKGKERGNRWGQWPFLYLNLNRRKVFTSKNSFFLSSCHTIRAAKEWGLGSNKADHQGELSESQGCEKDLVLCWANLWKQKLWKSNLKADFKTNSTENSQTSNAQTTLCIHLLRSQIMPNISHVIAADAFSGQWWAQC